MFRILHLSDLHVRTDTVWSTAPILSDAKRLILDQANRENVDVVVFTGDIAFSGKEAEYKIAGDWLDDLCLQPTGLNLDPKGVVFVPGNHDVDRSSISPAARAVEEALRKAEVQADVASYYQDSNSLELLLSRHKSYFAFCESFTGSHDLGKMCWSRVFDYKGKRIRFDGFNSSWLCRGVDDHRRLLIGQPQISELMDIRDDADVAIALAHHPISDLMEFDEHNVESHLRQHHDLFLRGHLHRADTVDRRSASGAYLELASGALHEGHEQRNHFSIIDLADDFCEVLIRTFVWQAGRWILDRNIFSDTEDGVGRFDLNLQKHLTPSTSLPPSLKCPPELNQEYLAAPRSGIANEYQEDHDDASDVLSSFPRFQKKAAPQDLAIRQTLLAEALLLAESDREIRVRKDAGSRYEGFVACVANGFQQQNKGATILHASCGGVSTGRDLQDLLAVTATRSITNLAAALRDYGPCMLILDDLDESDVESEEGATVDDTVQALLDLCENLIVVRISGLPLGGDSTIRIGALDAPDSRAYLECADNSTKFNSHVDYARVHRVTGGLPIHLDAVIDALAVTNLEGALAQVDSESMSTPNALPVTVVHEINRLGDAHDPEVLRIRRLLWTLCILDRGESLSAIKRLDGRQPIWARHANYLEQKGCLDIVDASPKYYEAKSSAHPASGEKILQVPRMVRDYVVSVMSKKERVELTKAAATLYFGSDWRHGTVRMRRRIAFSNEISTHQSGNEMTILRTMSSDSTSYFADSSSSSYSLGLSYIGQLKNKCFYGEAYEAAREFLGIASSHVRGMTNSELQHLQILAGGCARMIGERESCVEFLQSALPSIRSSKNKKVLTDVLVDLGLALRSIGKDEEATAVAKEILDNAPKDSSDYLQAKAMLVEIDEDDATKSGSLKSLASGRPRIR